MVLQEIPIKKHLEYALIFSALVGTGYLFVPVVAEFIKDIVRLMVGMFFNFNK